MPDRHRIRLRGPWWGKTCSAQDTPTDNDKPFKTAAPFRWHDQIPDNFVGTVGLTRKFNCSAGMAQAPEVWLTITAISVAAEVLLNGSSVGRFDAQSNIEIPVSSHLMPFNELQVLLSVSGRAQEILLGDVAVEMARD